MNLDQTPHPLVEDHYHIRELIENQEKRSQDRTYHKDRIKNREEREEDIKSYEDKKVLDFWCDVCSIEFKSQALKQIEQDWNNLDQHIAYYKSKCWNGHWCIRLITDRYKDSYYKRSRVVANDRAKHIDDILQPHETGFNMLYGKNNL